VDGFVTYRLDKHWLLRVSCSNILNETYVMGAEQIDVVDPSYPRDFTFQATFRF
jgi:outer membrane receptor for ferric coprogen and ferric-rhodotorulic acid